MRLFLKERFNQTWCWTCWMHNQRSAVWCVSVVRSQLSLNLAQFLFSVTVYKCLVPQVRVVAWTVRLDRLRSPPSHLCICTCVCVLGNNRHGHVPDICLGPMFIILGAIPPFAILLHIVFLIGNFANIFVFLNARKQSLLLAQYCGKTGGALNFGKRMN